MDSAGVALNTGGTSSRPAVAAGATAGAVPGAAAIGATTSPPAVAAGATDGAVPGAAAIDTANSGDAAPIADDPMDLSPAVSPGQVTEGSSRGVAGGMEPLSAASTVPMDGIEKNAEIATSMTAAAAATAAEAVPPGVDQPSEKSVTPGSTAAAASTTAATAAMASNIRSGRGAHVSRHKAPLDPQSYMMHGDEEEEERLANAAASASANQAGATPVALQHLWRPQKMPPISPVAAVVPGGGAPANMVIQQATPSQSEVKHGLAEAHEMDPNMELNKLKKKFEIWKREFKEKLKTTEDVLKKIDKLGGTASASRRYTGSSQGVQTSSSRPSAQTLQPSPNWTVDRASTPSASGTGAASMEPSPNQVVSPPRTNSTPRNPSMSSRASQPPSSRASSSSSVAPPPGSGSRASQPPAKRKGSGFMSSLFK
eukprot:gene7453-593_t